MCRGMNMEKLMQNGRAMKFVLAGIGVVVLLLAAGLFAMSALRDGEASATDGDAVQVEGLQVESSAKYAEKLFDCKVEDINDTAAVAKLLETMGMEGVTGTYTVQIAPESEVQVLTLRVEEAVQKIDRETFDGNMTILSQQLLALIPGVGKVQWNYSVVSADAKEESTVVSIDEAGATEELGKDVRSYGKSPKKLQSLLEKQAQ